MSVGPDTVLRFQDAIAQASDGVIGLAVSGGGDSVALMHLAAQEISPQRLVVLTVDHGLRPEAAAEISLVASQAIALGLRHVVARWQWDGTGNLQAAARAGRWDALAAMAASHDIAEIWMGHTEDDQIETFLMRLARGSGVDGLGAMAQHMMRDGRSVLRPLLGIKRADLRDWLVQRDVAWCDDPSNEDTRFDRIKARAMAAQLGDLGLTPKRILQTVDHMQAAQATLQRAAGDFAERHVQQVAGDLIFDAQALNLAGHDAPRRVMAAAFGWISGQVVRPRFESMCAAAAQVGQGETVTLAGCHLSPTTTGGMRMTREAARTVAQTGPSLWDNRWQISGPFAKGTTIKALGDGIRHCPDWRATDLPRASLLASPSVWENGKLIAAPLAGVSAGWSAQIVADFHSSAFAIED